MIELTLLRKTGGPLTKRIELSPQGEIISDGSACFMSSGQARRLYLPSVSSFADLINQLEEDQAIALGALRSDLPNPVHIATKRELDSHVSDGPRTVVSRTSDFIAFRPSEYALALIDIDTKEIPTQIAAQIEKLGGYFAALVRVLPEIASASRVIRNSTSSGLSRDDTGETFKGSGGLHIYLLIQDGSDVQRFLRVLHARCWLHGFGWLAVGVGGQLLERSLVDRTVGSPERLVFEAAPIVAAPLRQLPRVSEAFRGDALDTHTFCSDLGLSELAEFKKMQSAETHRLAPQLAVIKGEFISRQMAGLIERTGCQQGAARRAAERQIGGVLLSPVILLFDEPDLNGATVADVLATPSKFVGMTLADPLEGLDYGRCKAKIMRRSDGSIWIHSFAHGRTTYELRYDSAAVESAILSSERADSAAKLVEMALVADLSIEEEHRLIGLTVTRGGARATELKTMLKAARQAQKTKHQQGVRDADAAQRIQRRPRVPVPGRDDERLPVCTMLDQVLGNSASPEPPMRDLEGHPVEIRSRAPSMLHELSAATANSDDPKHTRLPPPSLPLLTKHDRYSFEHEIERHIEFTADTRLGAEVSVALPSIFIESYMGYRDSRLPVVSAVVTAPLVMADGILLAPCGLDREKGLVFRIEPALRALMPNGPDLSKAAAAEALRFLIDEWLCDAATTFTGKCVLIAFALTIIERVLLPERPGFMVTSGKRGGGKTTTIAMLVLAVTGKKPPAAAWSLDAEERRKALLSYLVDGVAVVVWDNILSGSAISDPTIEKVLTAESYTDRILGQTAHVTVPATTVMAFTGNNITPKGDLASRVLCVRLEADRPDPENRSFIHSDPIAWTLENRGKIVHCLYILLLCNPQLKPTLGRHPPTRFKRWWHLVGSAIEHAAWELVLLRGEKSTADGAAVPVSFAELFAQVETDDEDTVGLVDVLTDLHSVFSDRGFGASDVVRIINTPEDHADVSGRLYEFFAPETRRFAKELSAGGVGKRLAAIVGAPVQIGPHITMLKKRGSAVRHGTGAYWIHVLVRP